MTAVDWELCWIGVYDWRSVPSFSAAGTAYKFSALGVGSDPLEAMHDCLSQAAGQGVDTISIEQGILERYTDYTDPKAVKRARARKGRYCFVGLRWTDTTKPHLSWGKPYSGV